VTLKKVTFSCATFHRETFDHCTNFLIKYIPGRRLWKGAPESQEPRGNGSFLSYNKSRKEGGDFGTKGATKINKTHLSAAGAKKQLDFTYIFSNEIPRKYVPQKISGKLNL
jgi:hypothetical protein